jgi:uncharacterized protein YhdP
MVSQGRAPADFQLRSSLKNFNQPDIALEAKFSVLDLGIFTGGTEKEGAKKAPAKETPERKSKPPYRGPEIRAQGKVHIAQLVYTKFEGHNAEASWKLAGVTPGLDRINGTAQFEMVNGKINNIPLLSALAPVLRTDPSALVYSRMGGRLNVSQGTARTEDFQVRSSAVDIFAKGSVHLPDNKPDLLLTAKLPRGSIGGAVGEFANDEEGRPTFAFKLKGDWKPVLDTSAIQKKAAEKATQEIRKKAAEVLESEGKKLLEGIFKR